MNKTSKAIFRDLLIKNKWWLGKDFHLKYLLFSKLQFINFAFNSPRTLQHMNALQHVATVAICVWSVSFSSIFRPSLPGSIHEWPYKLRFLASSFGVSVSSYLMWCCSIKLNTSNGSPLEVDLIFYIETDFLLNWVTCVAHSRTEMSWVVVEACFRLSWWKNRSNENTFFSVLISNRHNLANDHYLWLWKTMKAR